MRFLDHATALFLAIAIGFMVVPGWAQSPPQAQMQTPEQRNAANIVFIHTGGQKGDSDDVVAVLKILLKAGYSLRKPDTDSDLVGGPGVDYFSDDDLTAAQEIADLVNKTRSADAPKLKPRRQSARTPPHYFGVWL